MLLQFRRGTSYLATSVFSSVLQPLSRQEVHTAVSTSVETNTIHATVSHKNLRCFCSNQASSGSIHNCQLFKFKFSCPFVHPKYLSHIEVGFKLLQPRKFYSVCSIAIFADPYKSQGPLSLPQNTLPHAAFCNNWKKYQSCFFREKNLFIILILRNPPNAAIFM